MTSQPVEVVALPLGTSVTFGDRRDGDRAMRVTSHEGFVVFSLWRGERCAATFRLDRATTPELVAMLVENLALA